MATLFYEQDEALRDIAEGYVKGNHTFDEMTDLMHVVLTGKHIEPKPTAERTIGDIYKELGEVIERINPKNQ